MENFSEKFPRGVVLRKLNTAQRRTAVDRQVEDLPIARLFSNLGGDHFRLRGAAIALWVPRRIQRNSDLPSPVRSKMDQCEKSASVICFLCWCFFVAVSVSFLAWSHLCNHHVQACSRLTSRLGLSAPGHCS